MTKLTPNGTQLAPLDHGLLSLHFQQAQLHQGHPASHIQAATLHCAIPHHAPRQYR